MPRSKRSPDFNAEAFVQLGIGRLCEIYVEKHNVSREEVRKALADAGNALAKSLTVGENLALGLYLVGQDAIEAGVPAGDVVECYTAVLDNMAADDKAEPDEKDRWPNLG